MKNNGGLRLGGGILLVLYILLIVTIVFLLYCLFLVVCSLFVNPKKEYEHNSRFYRALLNSATAGMLKVFRIKLYISGVEKVPVNASVMFVGNHRSNYDPIITWYVFRKWKPAFISKASNFKIPIFGRFIRKCCFMSIDREDPRKALPTINRAAKLLESGEVSISVYPEGTRSKSGKLLPFHNGVFKIAQKAGAPVAVIAISGTEKIAKNLLRFKSSHIHLNVVNVILASEVQNMKTNALGKLISEELEKELQHKG